MHLPIFKMERFQSLWENIVEYNLAESGVKPFKLKEIIEMTNSYEIMLNIYLGYIQTNGSKELRSLISEMYKESTIENILVTNGSAEANFLSIFSLLNKGDEVIVMLPNYMQIWNLVKGLGCKVKALWLKEDGEKWFIDIEELKSIISKSTKLIALCNPNNPTGAIIQEKDIKAIIEIAKDNNSWILSDEVYRGTEINGDFSPTIWGKYEKAIIVSGLSKAYGLPGLRIGWILSEEKLIKKLWAYHDYTTIAPSCLSDFLAQQILKPDIRFKVIQRARNILKSNIEILDEWIRKNNKILSYIPPKATAVAFIKQKLGMPSLNFCKKLLHEKSVLTIPSEYFGMKGYIRIGYGQDKDYLKNGLEKISEFLNNFS
ncbi:MAG: aminotransferase class I/II-fold pyridoxal phosphate-dependent enzyme [Nitrososphaerota archaeon]